MPTDENEFGMENLSSFFDNVGKNLQNISTHSRSIHNNSKNSDLHLSAIEKELNQFHRDFNKANNQNDRSNNDSRTYESLNRVATAEDNNAKAIKNASNNYYKEEVISRQAWAKVGDSIVAGFKSAISVFTKRITSAFNDIRNSYLSNYADITVRLNLIESEYQDLYRDAAKSFRDFNLNNQFNPDDFVKALEGVLDTGLRGDITERMAMQNLINKRLIPALNVNSRTYLTASKQLGEGFDKTVVAMTRYSENQLGMGPEERLNQVIDEFSTSLKYIGATNGMSNEEVNGMISNVYLASQTVASNLSANSADILDRLIKEAATGSVSGRSILSILGGGTADEVQAKLRTQEGTAELYAKFASELSGLGAEGGEATNVLAEALGESVDDVMTMFGDLYYSNIKDSNDLLQKMQETQKNFSATESYQEGLQALIDGQGVNAEDAYTNALKNNGIVENVALIAGAIPVWNEISSLVGGIWSGLSGLGYGALEGLAKGAFSRIGSGSAAGAGGGLLSKLGIGAGSAGGGSGAGSALAGISAGTVAQFAGGAGAAIMMAADAISGWRETEGSTGDKAGMAAKKALLGYSDINNINNGGQAVGAVLKNTSKGALLGTAIAPGIGTAIGGLAAGLTSTVAILDEYNSEEARRARSVRNSATEIKKAGEAFDSLKTATDEFNKSSEIYEDTTKKISTLNKGSEDYDSTMKDLVERYKELNPKAEVSNELTKTQLEYLNRQLELQREEERENAKKELKKAEKKFDKIDIENILSEYEQSQVRLEGARGAENLRDYLTSLGVDLEGGLSQNSEGQLSYFTRDENGKLVQKAFTSSQLGRLSGFTSLAKSYAEKSGTGSDYWDTAGYLNNYIGLEGATEADAETVSNILNAIDTARSILDQSVALGLTGGNVSDRALSMIREYDNLLYALDSNGEVNVREKYKGYLPSDYLNVLGVKDRFGESPKFRYGLSYVPYDNYPALLHQGESVLTASESRNYMRLNGTGVIAKLLADNSSTSSIDSITRAVTDQTEILSGLIKEILEIMHSTARTKIISNYATVSENALKFGGV